ncbi:sensor histidine kinase [Undibacterium luofuense]|uniref:Histidine kinase n=1 Tax=Undibacterium luofuense TaxID=2828733 RepID=A0A941I6G3_9BURK|nr:histidine kinase [Undibacterium luofuense]MBR7782651.1 histidine kinase [Undibacterium luofuense]
MNKPEIAPPTLRSIVLEVRDLLREGWWKFFDWLAVISWKYLFFVSFLVLIIGGIMSLGGLAFWLIVVSILIKSLAGGKHRAELAAVAAASRADMEALERRVLEAEMAALQAQIEPHFLFNTLALIGQLIETQPQQAAKVHADLIRYLRSAMPQMRQQGMGTLGQQIELSRAYLNIMQARMQQRLQFSIDVPEALALEAFPSMMVQTLVENAIKHGLEPSTEGGEIRISARQQDGFTEVEVTDNGVGLDMHADDGVGLSNIRERLRALYKGQASLLTEIPADGGATFILRVPSPASASQTSQASQTS